jgi:hypothetical protein
MKSKFFEKQENGIRICAAAWVADKGKPDHPSFWNTCRLRMEDGSVYKVKKESLSGHVWKWIGD